MLTNEISIAHQGRGHVAERRRRRFTPADRQEIAHPQLADEEIRGARPIRMPGRRFVERGYHARFSQSESGCQLLLQDEAAFVRGVDVDMNQSALTALFEQPETLMRDTPSRLARRLPESGHRCNSTSGPARRVLRRPRLDRSDRLGDLPADPPPPCPFAIHVPFICDQMIAKWSRPSRGLHVILNSFRIVADMPRNEARRLDLVDHLILS